MNAVRGKGRRAGRIGQAGLALVLVASGSCSHAPLRQSQGPVSIAPPGQSPLTIPDLENDVLRFADTYALSVANAADRVAEKVKTREALVESLRWKLEQANAAYVSATGPNPVWNALDMVVLSVVSRMVIQDAKSREIFGAELGPLLKTQQELEANAWALASQFLTAEQRGELSSLIAEWREQNPRERSLGALHFREFAAELGKGVQRDQVKPTSIFSLLYINPFAGIDPTTIAIEQSRELAARTVAFAERAPTLLRWQAELLALQLSGQPEAQQILGDAGRLSRSAESVAKTAEGLPSFIDEQRREAIDQFFAGVSTEREAIFGGLDSHEPAFRSLLGQTRSTLEAGRDMSNSLDAAVKSLDAFVHYVSPPPPQTAPPAQPGKPFNVLDYGTTATQVGAMAKDLAALLRSVDQTAPQLAGVTGRAAEDLKGVVDHAFWRGLLLILTLLVGSVPAALAYRALSRRLFTRPEPAAPADRI